jgi:hypothetical protein
VPVSVDVYVGTPGFEAALQAELAPGTTSVLVPGVVACEAANRAPPIDPVFARQVLPGAA